MQHTPLVEFHHPQGFLSLAKNIGIKDTTLDLTVIYSTVRARAAAMFTRNRFPGAPVIIGRKHVANGYVRALVINSKNANVAMGKQGIDNAIETCRIVGKELGISSYDVLPFSTGVIGRPLPMDKIRAGLKGIRSELKPDNLKLAAEAIMTTDKYPKYFSVSGRSRDHRRHCQGCRHDRAQYGDHASVPYDRCRPARYVATADAQTSG